MKGQTLGKWVLLEPLELTGPQSTRKWLCRCDCGTLAEVRLCEMKRGKSLHCRKCATKNATEKRTKYVDGVPSTEHPLYAIWIGMHQRCYNIMCKDWPSYGERGIRICSRWFTFSNFVLDMGERPSLNHSIDRMDTNGDYEPDNCRWATPKEQQNNRRDQR